MDPDDVPVINLSEVNEAKNKSVVDDDYNCTKEEPEPNQLSDAFCKENLCNQHTFQVNNIDAHFFNSEEEEEEERKELSSTFFNLNLDTEFLQPIITSETDVNEGKYFEDAIAESKYLVEESENWLEFDFSSFQKVKEINLESNELLSAELDFEDNSFFSHKKSGFGTPKNGVCNDQCAFVNDDIVILDLENPSYKNEISIIDLPQEVLLKIFFFFNQRELCQYIAPVCSTWFHLAKDPTLWTSISSCDYEDVYDDLLIKVILAWCKKLQKLELNRRSELTYHDFEKILSHCPHLKSLSMAFCSQINEQVLGLLTGHCRMLTDINIEGCDITDESFYKLIGLPLTTICVSHCNKLSNDGGIFLARNFRSLIEINFDGIQWITEEFIEILVDQHFMTLEKVYLDGENLTDRAVKVLSRCSQLRCLSFSFCSNMNPQTLDWVAKCDKLDHLKLRKGVNFTNKSLLDYLKTIKEEQSQKFKYLNLAECTEISDECLFFISENCPNLEILDLSWCWEVSDDGITFVLDSCHKLKELHLRGLHELYGNAFPRIMRTMPDLKFLDLSQCNKVRDELIEQLVRHKKDLIVWNYYGDIVVNEKHRRAHLIS